MEKDVSGAPSRKKIDAFNGGKVAAAGKPSSISTVAKKRRGK